MPLTIGTLLKERWRVKEKVGGGSFGNVYLAYDTKKKKDVAIKTEEKTPQTDPCLRMEFDILAACNGKPHFCKLYGSGETQTFNFIVMQICGPSFSALRKSTPVGYFSPGTTFMLLIQCIQSVEILHGAGYLHRDLKPANFCMGRYGSARRIVYLLDFGLARKFVDESNRIRPPRISCHFRGTVRYASVQIHLKRELGRGDDLWSLFYMMVEMMAGKLPWHNIRVMGQVLEMKQQDYGPEILTERLPGKDRIMAFVNHIKDLKYADTPDYNKCVTEFRSALWEMEMTEDSPYDWEENYKRCRKKPSWLIKPLKSSSS